MVATIKTVLVIHSFICGLFFAQFDGKEPDFGEAVVRVFMGLVGMPLCVFVVVRANMGMGHFDPPWDPPRWRDNPINSINPLPFLQFGTIYFGALGCGALISMIWMSLDAAPWMMVATCGSLGIWIGRSWLEARYAKRDAQESDQNSGET